MRSSPVKKMSWPEVVGIMAPAAADKINADRPDVTVELFPVSVASTMPPGYDAKRVRVYFDVYESHGLVAYTPIVG
jgi:hypothetical protein